MALVKRFLLAFIFLTSCARAQERILIAAASDLKFALDSIVLIFKNANSGSVEVSYGSSGKLSEQISNGAPFHIFFSADIHYPRMLEAKGFTSSDVYPYGIGRLVVWSKKMDPVGEGMRSLLSPSVRKIAMANPAHAPYGKRAEEALTYFNIIEAVKSKLVYGENISQAAQFVTSGAADIGIVALSLALSPSMQREGGKYYLIPETSHSALEQGVVITRQGNGNSLAKAFMTFMKGETATGILTHFGFTTR